MTNPSAQAIARVLLDQWDPLGVAANDSAPETEYIHEAERIAQLLDEGAAESQIVNYLGQQGLGHPDAGRDRRTAAAIVALSHDAI